MKVVGIVSPGAMGSAVGAAYTAAGARVVATLEGRSERTRGLAETAGLELLPDLDAVVAESELVFSIVPPGDASDAATAIAAAATRTRATPVVADLNATSPATVREIAAILAGAGLELVDGSISGGPPHADYTTRVYLSGSGADALASGAPPRLDARVVGADVGLASAVKMCTASMYKGSTALLAHALLTAHEHNVLREVLDDLRDSFPAQVDRAARTIAVAATKSQRFVGEMREIAATQAGAGLTPALFDAMAEVYEAFSRSPLAAQSPEDVDRAPLLEEVLERLKSEPGSEATTLQRS